MINDALKILIIDDDKQNAELLCMLLSRLGYNAKYADDPYFGIELLKKFKPLDVFTDIKMPKMNGYDVANYIRNSEEFKNTILVAFTGIAHEKEIQKSYENGYRYHLTKPVSIELIIKTIEEIKRDLKLNLEGRQT